MYTNELVENNMQLVKWIVHEKIRYIPESLRKNIEDLYQEGYVLLTQAARNYNKDTGYKFSTYATNTVYLGLRAFLDRHSEKRYSFEGFSLDNEVYKKDDESISWKDLLQFEEDRFNLIEMKELINKAEIKDIEKIIELRLNGYTQKQIGEILGVAQNTISKRIRKLEKLIMS